MLVFCRGDGLAAWLVLLSLWVPLALLGAAKVALLLLAAVASPAVWGRG
jgi:hypothetical protein